MVVSSPLATFLTRRITESGKSGVKVGPVCVLLEQERFLASRQLNTHFLFYPLLRSLLLFCFGRCVGYSASKVNWCIVVRSCFDTCKIPTVYQSRLSESITQDPWTISEIALTFVNNYSLHIRFGNGGS